MSVGDQNEEENIAEESDFLFYSWIFLSNCVVFTFMKFFIQFHYFLLIDILKNNWFFICKTSEIKFVNVGLFCLQYFKGIFITIHSHVCRNT